MFITPIWYGKTFDLPDVFPFYFEDIILKSLPLLINGKIVKINVIKSNL